MTKQKLVLSRTQIQSLIDNADSFELQLVIMTMTTTGMRVGELVNFKPNWINNDDKTIYIQQNATPIQWTPKRDSERLVPITDALLMNLKRHLGNRKTGYVFQSQKSKSSRNNGDKSVTRRTFCRYSYRSIIRKTNALANKTFRKNIGTHIFRASYASHLLRAGLDLESIRKLLGHSDIKTTLIYCRGLPDYHSWDDVRRVELMDITIK